MISRFEICLSRVLKHEGGNVDDPLDRGGRTSRGCTQATYDAYRRRHGKPYCDVWLMTDAECRDIYLAQYWIPAGCGALPVGLDYCVFDTAVNSGPRRAGKFLQRALGMEPGEVDGIAGPGTMRHVQDLITSGEVEQLIPRFIQQRRQFLQDLIQRDPSQQRFAKGWENRIVAVENAALGDRCDG